MSENLIKYQDLKDNINKLEIKSYLPYSIKRVLLDTIFETCVSENENGIKAIDFGLIELVKKYKLINEYTNVDFTEVEVLVAFDEMSENGILKQILDEIPQEELDFFDNVIEQEIQQIREVDNSFQNVITKSLNNLINRLPDEKGMAKLIKDLPKSINKIDPEKLSYLTQAIGFNNGKHKSGDK